jgi:signal transduction histidine kinase
LLIGRHLYQWNVLVALGTVAVLVASALYAWRRRPVPGALSYVAFNFLLAAWILSRALAASAVNPPAKVFWHEFEVLTQLAFVTAAVCFALEYASVGRWLTRRCLMVLAVPPVLFVPLALSNGVHGGLWTVLWQSGHPALMRGPLGSMFWWYGYALSFTVPAVFLWLFIRSPLHRWPAALCLLGQVVARVGYLASERRTPDFGLDPMPPVFLFVSLMYAVALFRFRLFDLLPVARSTVVEEMLDGVLVLDLRNRILDLNPAAERAFQVTAAHVRGKDALLVLPAFAGLRSKFTTGGAGSAEVSLGSREFLANATALHSRYGTPVGEVLLLRDVSELKRARERLADRERSLAVLGERNRVARELHDGLGQVLGFTRMQTEAALTLMARGSHEDAARLLRRVLHVARDAHSDVRDYILTATASPDDGLLASLGRHMAQFESHFGIRAELACGPGIDDALFDLPARHQLGSIIKEALTNARKHARPGVVRVSFRVENRHVLVAVEDDGAGFEIAQDADGPAHSFGVRFMRERAAEIGAALDLQSSPGRGTRITVEIPIREMARGAHP